MNNKGTFLANWPVIALVIVSAVLVFNQYQISTILSPSVGVEQHDTFVDDADSTSAPKITGKVAAKDLSGVDISKITSTAAAIAAVFPLDEVKTGDDAIAIMFPTGVPAYGKEMGASFDDPIGSLSLLAGAYPALKAQVQADPVLWKRYLNLATKPVGISCEFCCGVGAVGISPDGELRCGCSHSPAVQSVTLWLMKNTDYTDAQILREVMRWKTLWFPKNMIELGLNVAGKDASELAALPGMVGGC